MARKSRGPVPVETWEDFLAEERRASTRTSEGSSVPEAYRPRSPVPSRDDELAIDRRARRFDVDEEREWYESEWSEEAILARRHQEAEGAVPAEHAECRIGERAGRLAATDEGVEFARLLACTRALVEEGRPTGARTAVRRQRARRILYVHRLLADPDFRGEYMGTLSREWAHASFFGDRGRWYTLVDWALGELEWQEEEAGRLPTEHAGQPATQKEAKTAAWGAARYMRARQALDYVETNAPDVKDPAKQWEWLREHGCPAYEEHPLPGRGTWLRYVREIDRSRREIHRNPRPS